LKKDSHRLHIQLDPVEDAKEEVARQLEIEMKMNRDCTLDKSLIYKEKLINYKRERGLQPPERCGD